MLRIFATVVITMALFSGLEAKEMSKEQQIEKGKQLAFERRKGNCLACHMMGDGELPGNIGPPMIAMKARFPDPKVLYNQIYDATVKNPNSVMPPFGKHGILTDEEVKLIVNYLYTL